MAGSWPAADHDAHTVLWVESLRKRDGHTLVLVAEIDGAVVGFVEGGPARRKDPGAEVEIYVMHVHPDHRGRAIGADLWDAACHVLRGPELASVYVDTLAELRCCSFYARRGGLRMEIRPRDFCGAPRTHVTYMWPKRTRSTERAHGLHRAPHDET
ncbi:MAG TPA: GNAT family N-acetyltransferase [Polyangiaceae bacterium]|nr:GNAT family N-acetyltransferase [Polyangiaceae bacterium]